MQVFLKTIILVVNETVSEEVHSDSEGLLHEPLASVQLPGLDAPHEGASIGLCLVQIHKTLHLGMEELVGEVMVYVEYIPLAVSVGVDSPIDLEAQIVEPKL